MTTYTKKLADIAIKQHEKYHLMREQEPQLAAQIKEYWLGIGAFKNVSVPWSAVFVSWCVKQAGATKEEFRFAASHSRFAMAAIANYKNKTGVFQGRDPNDYVPKVGDIIQNNRSGNKFDYAYASKNDGYESHSAIVIEVGSDSKGRYLRTIGGNEGDTVGMKEVKLKVNGLLNNSGGMYISVVETLK